MNPRVLILSGPTHEYIDPVRFIGNASSGRMGKAIAEEAVRLGYDVELVSGPVSKDNLPNLPKDRIHTITSASEMLDKALLLFPQADITIFAAAVADYTPAETQTEKMAKSSTELTLKLKPTADIAKTLSAGKRPNQITIGFALQTADGEANARRKLQSKKMNGIVLNTPATLNASTGTFSFLSQQAASFDDWGRIDKHECAQRIFEKIKTQMEVT